MQVSQSGLDSFHGFASQELSDDRGHSREGLVRLWRARQGRVESIASIASIRCGVDDDGRLHDLDHVDAQIRAELGLPVRRR